MKVLVAYDVSDDRLRADVARACGTYGLVRVQLSLFAGDISERDEGRLRYHLSLYADDPSARGRRAIHVLRLCAGCFGDLRQMGSHAVEYPDRSRRGLRVI